MDARSHLLPASAMTSEELPAHVNTALAKVVMRDITKEAKKKIIFEGSLGRFFKGFLGFFWGFFLIFARRYERFTVRRAHIPQIGISTFRHVQ